MICSSSTKLLATSKRSTSQIEYVKFYDFDCSNLHTVNDRTTWQMSANIKMIDSPIIIILSEFYHRPHLLLFLLDEDGWERERDKIPKISIRNTNISEHVFVGTAIWSEKLL